MREIFDNLFCSLPMDLFTLEAFESFQTLFLAINACERNLDLKFASFSSRFSESLIGLEKIYEIIISTAYSDLFSTASVFLVTLNLKLSKAASVAKTEI